VTTTTSRRERASERLDLIFHALSHRTRRELLERLAAGPASVSELAQGHAMSLPAISKHLRVLESAALVRRTQEGRVHTCILTAGPLKDAEEWVAAHRHYWESQLDRLAAHLTRGAGAAPTKPKRAPKR
jgi:DNA-binding transcriptional ArsR family regulator